MKILYAIILFLSASFAQAETVTVISGEHPTFSRLVLTIPQQSEWQLGRTPTGYELHIPLADLRYDVSKVFELIPRDRLKGIYTDPQTGNLHLTMQCICHAIPFSLDAQTIVIDLKDGPAPETSSFELSLQGDALPALQSKVAQRPRARFVPDVLAADQTYDWLSGPSASGSVNAVAFPMILPVLPVGDFFELEQALVEQMAEGAARGVVDLAVPGRGGPDAPKPVPTGQLRMVEAVGMRVGNAHVKPSGMQADGETCISDSRLNIAEWGEESDVPGQIARARMHLFGEFDVPQPDAIATQARLYIFLGFGAEAIATLNAMDQDHGDVWLWVAIASVIDGNPVAPSSFEGMAQCDSFAALWATLAAPVSALEQPNIPALQRAFSALPRHLRLAVGEDVTKRLLALNQPAAAQGIIDAMGRGTPTTDTATLLAETDLHLNVGSEDSAVETAKTALDAGGISAPKALIALVRAKIAANQAIAPDVAVALAAMEAEYADEALAPDLAEALMLALIGSGQFRAAMPEDASTIPPVFWDILAQRGSDDDLLQFAFELPKAAISPTTANAIASRLRSMGFGDTAADWHDLGTQEIIPAHSADGTAMPTESDAPSNDSVAEQPPEPSRELRWQQDWAAIATAEGDPWRDLAAMVASSSAVPASEQPLAEATRLVQSSKTTRDLIDGLLQSTTPTGG
jgi:hypothetical protein